MKKEQESALEESARRVEKKEQEGWIKGMRMNKNDESERRTEKSIRKLEERAREEWTTTENKVGEEWKCEREREEKRQPKAWKK